MTIHNHKPPADARSEPKTRRCATCRRFRRDTVKQMDGTRVCQPCLEVFGQTTFAYDVNVTATADQLEELESRNVWGAFRSVNLSE